MVIIGVVTAIELRNVGKVYGTGKLQTPALSDVNIKIETGEMVAIVGPSGSGKSTVMHIMGLLDRPTKGELLINGSKINMDMGDKKLASLRSQKIGFVFQQFNLLPRFSAIKNVMLPSTYRKIGKASAKNRARDLLGQVGLADRLNHKPTQLSGGEIQRVAIARSLINNPDIILADEPTGNLDSKNGEEIIDILKRFNKSGKTVVIITHDMKVAQKADRIIKIFDGKVVA